MTATDNNKLTGPEAAESGRSTAGKNGQIGLPRNLLRYVLEESGWHQLFLAALAVAAFLLEFVPLELTRRIINDLAKHRDFHLVIILGVLYFAVTFVQGSTKLALNVYRGWISERATRNLRNKILAITETSPTGLHSLEAKIGRAHV